MARYRKKSRPWYTVAYKLYECDNVRTVSFRCDNKANAYDRAVYEWIPYICEGEHPYSAWVESVKYDNGNVRKFNTFEGMPY